MAIDLEPGDVADDDPVQDVKWCPECQDMVRVKPDINECRRCGTMTDSRRTSNQ